MAEKRSRRLSVPPDLKNALANDDAARVAFEKLPESHKSEYVEWIREAKKEETRSGRIAKALKMLVSRRRGAAEKSDS